MKDQPLWVYLLCGFVGLLGGYVVRVRVADKARIAKDLRGKIDAIEAELDDIEDLAMEYYLSNGNEASASVIGLRMKIKLKRVGHTIGLVYKSDISNNPSYDRSLLVRLASFREAVTGDDFESRNRVPSLPNDPKFTEISKTSVFLKDALERIYEKL